MSAARCGKCNALLPAKGGLCLVCSEIAEAKRSENLEPGLQWAAEVRAEQNFFSNDYCSCAKPKPKYDGTCATCAWLLDLTELNEFQESFAENTGHESLVSAQQQPPIPVRQVGEFGYCHQCGSRHELDGDFCAKCGARRIKEAITSGSLDRDSSTAKQQSKAGNSWLLLLLILIIVCTVGYGIFVNLGGGRGGGGGGSQDTSGSQSESYLNGYANGLAISEPEQHKLFLFTPLSTPGERKDFCQTIMPAAAPESEADFLLGCDDGLIIGIHSLTGTWVGTPSTQ